MIYAYNLLIILNWYLPSPSLYPQMQNISYGSFSFSMGLWVLLHFALCSCIALVQHVEYWQFGFWQLSKEGKCLGVFIDVLHSLHMRFFSTSKVNVVKFMTSASPGYLSILDLGTITPFLGAFQGTSRGLPKKIKFSCYRWGA